MSPEPPPTPVRPVRWGFSAPGGIARDFAADARLGGVDVLAVASRSAERAAAFAQEFGIARPYGSLDALLADADVDVVYIASPHHFHAENALRCLRAGKHVLVEKPFTANRDEAEQIAAVAAEHGLLAQEAMWIRFLPHMRRIRELVGTGAIGDVRTVTAEFAQPFPAEAAQRILDPELGGGALMDLGAYPVSFVRDLLGVPTVVEATSRRDDRGLDRETSMLLGWADGAQALLTVSLDHARVSRAVVAGTRGRIEIDPIWFAPTGFRLIAPDGEVLESFSSEVEGRGLQLQALAVNEAIRAGRTTTTEMPMEQSLDVMGMLDRIRHRAGLR
jgi:predicted dehydrogenase